MHDFRIATAQFENKSGDKRYNLSIIDLLSKKASSAGAKAIAFHECSITGYTFARHLSKEQMLDLAEIIPEGESIQCLTKLAQKNKITILAGLFEKDWEDKLYKTYVCVNEQGLVAKYRKLHPFINPYLT
ncbi:MAG TPA: nitrilase-related carbon-nitrogen hydrolase, partial [Flavisolibacter sp.]|nr:nitrilase-related carbon-nitrogen hydrolase [Flavisolibacter sp.]